MNLEEIPAQDFGNSLLEVFVTAFVTVKVPGSNPQCKRYILLGKGHGLEGCNGNEIEHSLIYDVAR